MPLPNLNPSSMTSVQRWSEGRLCRLYLLPAKSNDKSCRQVPDLPICSGRGTMNSIHRPPYETRRLVQRYDHHYRGSLGRWSNFDDIRCSSFVDPACRLHDGLPSRHRRQRSLRHFRRNPHPLRLRSLKCRRRGQAKKPEMRSAAKFSW